MQQISIDQLMAESGVAFGTSGARGLVTQMTDRVCYAYTMAFIQYVQAQEPKQKALAVAGDLRPSTGRIINAVCSAAVDMGWTVHHCGRVPSPAVALYGLQHAMPSIMVTGSHIPDDRNGIKFNVSTGEITKADETGIRSQTVNLPDHVVGASVLPVVESLNCESKAAQAYVNRFVQSYGPTALQGLKIGVYQHSSVGRDLAVQIVQGLGAQITALGRSETFIPVDTEAIRPEDVALAKQWASAGDFDALISMDGDADRPLLANAEGEWLRGDVLGILVARALNIQGIALPVSCNSAAEKCGSFAQVLRTKIGSPFVIEGMVKLAAQGLRVAGYEANGGFLLQSDLQIHGNDLKALPTRDAMLPVIAVLAECKRQKTTVTQLLAELPPRFTASDRLKEFPTDLGKLRLTEFTKGGEQELSLRANRWFGELCGTLKSIEQTDGLRMVFSSGDVVHLRTSGNAPELRCYNESGSAARVVELNRECIQRLEAWRDRECIL